MEESWAIVELMGHVKLAGKLTEEEKFGVKMGRLDIPIGRDPSCPNCSAESVADAPCPVCKCGTFVTQYFGGGSVYRITYCTEAVARHVNRQTSPAPVSPWDFPKQIGSTKPVGAVVDDPVYDEPDFGNDPDCRNDDDVPY